MIGILMVSVVSLACVVALLMRKPGAITSQLEAIGLRVQNCERGILESAVNSRDAKQASTQLVASFNQLDGRLTALSQISHNVADALGQLQSVVPLQIEQGTAKLKQGIGEGHAALRLELSQRDEMLGRSLTSRLESGLTGITESLGQMRTETGAVLTASRTAIEGALKTELGAIRSENGVALESMRLTVDEKLHATLEQRLGESFKLVSERLELVHRGLGEMKSLATGVGDLRRVLTNVKTRGTWGEVQLENLLDQILSPEQYAKNVATKPDSGARVEFAIRFPGRSADGVVWLPIDAKFPMEDYQRLVDAQERVDVEAVEAAGRALEGRIKAEAKSIRERYIEPPHTTDFAVLYLPIEGLYAEVLRRPGLADTIQREYKIVLCGPTTLAAMLNSLQMGFRTLAIEKRSSEVWAVLGTVKAEFGKFGEALAHTKKKLEEASNSIDKAEQRNRVLTRKLDVIDEISVPEATPVVEAVESRLLRGLGDEAA
jgi:DNA recombination protein RmuC